MFNIGDKVEIDIVASLNDDLGIDPDILSQAGFPSPDLKKVTGTIECRVTYDFLQEDLDAWFVGDILIDGEEYTEDYQSGYSDAYKGLQLIHTKHLTKLD